jgi:hypothetical protein
MTRVVQTPQRNKHEPPPDPPSPSRPLGQPPRHDHRDNRRSIAVVVDVIDMHAVFAHRVQRQQRQRQGGGGRSSIGPMETLPRKRRHPQRRPHHCLLPSLHCRTSGTTVALSSILLLSMPSDLVARRRWLRWQSRRPLCRDHACRRPGTPPVAVTVATSNLIMRPPSQGREFQGAFTRAVQWTTTMPNGSRR